MRRSAPTDHRISGWVRTHRMTRMLCIIAGEEWSTTLFIFSGTREPYQQIVTHGHVQVENNSSCLTHGSFVCVREDIGGVNSDFFYQWALNFVNHVKGLTLNGREVLLTYDGYCSHMSVRALQLFDSNEVVVYALPAHTFDRTQLCDVRIFGKFKTTLIEGIEYATEPYNIDRFDTFDFCKMITRAFHQTFTYEVLSISFQKSGVWPVDSKSILSIPFPRSNKDIHSLLSVEELDRLLGGKRLSAHNSIL